MILIFISIAALFLFIATAACFFAGNLLSQVGHEISRGHTVCEQQRE
jgi:hypothetical protein